MFNLVGNTPVLGCIQNMSIYLCPKCGHSEHLFGKDGAKEMSSTLGKSPCSVKMIVIGKFFYSISEFINDLLIYLFNFCNNIMHLLITEIDRS